MANTSTHPWTVNGTRLDTWAYNIRTKRGWLYTPGFNQGNIEVPGRGGDIFVPGKRRDAGQAVLQMSVWDRDVNGALVGTDRYATWRKNMDTLLALFDSTYGLLDVRQQISATKTRQAWCEVVAAIDPETVENWGAEFKVALRIPDVYWQDTADVEHIQTGVVNNGTYNVTPFVDATAPMEDLWVVVDGPVTNPRVTDTRTGHYVQYNGALLATECWTVNTTTWSSRVGALATAYTETGTNKTAQTVADGLYLPRLFGMSAAAPGQSFPRVTFGGSGVSAATRLRIKGRRKYQ